MSVAVRDVLSLLDVMAPPETAEAWDNVGLLAGHPDSEVNTVLCALDLTQEVLNEARTVGAELIVTHHPILFRGRKNLRTDEAEGRMLCDLVRSGISLIAVHTNFDTACPGVNDALADRLGLHDVQILPEGLRVGQVTPVPLSALRARVQTLLGDVVRMYGPAGKTVGRIGVLGGSGADWAEKARCAGAEVFITGEIGYHRAADLAANGLCVLEAGHAATERPAISLLAGALQEAADAIKYNLRVICSTVSEG